MRIIKLNAIDSTNSYLRDLSAKEQLEDMTVVVTKTQKKGRGQRDALWESESGKNLTISVFKRIHGLNVESGFYVSMATSLAIVTTLKKVQIPKLKVKWPNDILSENKKICGILIENIAKQKKINAAIIGIGLNVNQTRFRNLPQASSLKAISGTTFNLDELLNYLLQNLETYLDKIKAGKKQEIREAYEKLLYRKGKPSTFQNLQGDLFPAFIKGIDEYGNLRLLMEDDVEQAFELKQIKLMF